MLTFDDFKQAFKWSLNLKRDLIKARSLEYILIIALTLSVSFGTVIFLIDPNVHSLSDGIWYAWVTVTHVGYGDIVPSSFLGRLLGALLILFGLGMFALFTASLSAALIGRDLGQVKMEMKQVEKETHDTGSRSRRTITERVRA